MIDYFVFFEIAYDATEEQIKSKYRELAVKYHPDKNPTTIVESTKKFRELQTAYNHLLDPNYRIKFSKKVKKETKPLPSDMAIVDAPPPKFDIWGRPLSNSERNYWNELNKTEVFNIDKVKKKHDNGFIDNQNYVNDDREIHLR